MADYENNISNDKPFTLFNNETGESIEIPIIKGSITRSVVIARLCHSA